MSKNKGSDKGEGIQESLSQRRIRDPGESQQYGFNRQIYIGKLEDRCRRIAESPGARWFVKDEDMVVERVLEEPIPIYDQVDFGDDSDLANHDLKRLFVRLYKRLETLKTERLDIKKRAIPSTGRDYKVNKIDLASKYIQALLYDPTCSEQHSNKLKRLYSEEIAKLGPPPASTEVSVQLNDGVTTKGQDKDPQRKKIEKQDFTPVDWHKVTIHLRANHRIAYQLEPGGSWHDKSMYEIGLIDKRLNKPNIPGTVLIGLAKKRKYPPRKKSTSAERTAKQRLKKALQELLQASNDPFAKFNEADGWRPFFTLIDRRKAADERAKEKASHTAYDSGTEYPFEQEDDMGAIWLKTTPTR